MTDKIKKESSVKEEKPQKSEKKDVKIGAKGKYIYSVGRRKEARAKVRLYNGKGDVMVNNKDLNKIFLLLFAYLPLSKQTRYRLLRMLSSQYFPGVDRLFSSVKNHFYYDYKFLIQCYVHLGQEHAFLLKYRAPA